MTQAKSRSQKLRCTWRKCKWQKRNVTSRRVLTHHCSEKDGLRHTLHFSKSYYELILIYNFEQKYYTTCSSGAKLIVYSIHWELFQIFYVILHLIFPEYGVCYQNYALSAYFIKQHWHLYGPKRTCHIMWSQASKGSWSGKRELICIFKQPQNSVTIGQWFNTKIDIHSYFEKHNKTLLLSTRKTGLVERR